RNDESRTANSTVDQDREIKFAINVGAVFDVETGDLLAGRAGLLGDQRVAQHFLRIGNHFLDRLGEAHAALCIGWQFLELALAASASMDLALDDIKRSGKRLCPFFRLFDGIDSHTIGDRCAVGVKQALGLVFVNIHLVVLYGFPTDSASRYDPNLRPIIDSRKRPEPHKCDNPALPGILLQRRSDADAGFAKTGDRSHRLVEFSLFVLVEINFNDALDAIGTDHGRHADIHVLDAVLARKLGSDRQDALLVLEVGFSHLDGRCSRSVESRAGLEQADDFRAAVTGALDDLVELVLAGPAHLDEIRQRDTGNG